VDRDVETLAIGTRFELAKVTAHLHMMPENPPSAAERTSHQALR